MIYSNMEYILCSFNTRCKHVSIKMYTIYIHQRRFGLNFLLSPNRALVGRYVGTTQQSWVKIIQEKNQIDFMHISYIVACIHRARPVYVQCGCPLCHRTIFKWNEHRELFARSYLHVQWNCNILHSLFPAKVKAHSLCECNCICVVLVAFYYFSWTAASSA